MNTISDSKTPQSPFFLSNPVVLQRLEGLAVFVLSTYAWHFLGGSWWLFLVLLFTPDVSMLGYLVNARLGSSFYNLVHSYIFPLLLLAIGFLSASLVLLLGGFLLLAHIGLDRTLGYGLKLPTGFKHTHLSTLN